MILERIEAFDNSMQKSTKLCSDKVDYSEKEMSDEFFIFLINEAKVPGIGKFDSVYREIQCRQGRPDFITVRNRNGYKNDSIPKSSELVNSAILGLLKYKSPRTMKYLLSKINYSERSIKNTLSDLIKSGHIYSDSMNHYFLGTVFKQLNVEICAFELKLNNDKRAIFQAQQSRAYANVSIIVIPPSKKNKYEKHYKTMDRWGIGLASFDLRDHHFKIEKKPQKSLALSPENRIYAIKQIFADEKA